jgi:2Fe-2S ferredoxin
MMIYVTDMEGTEHALEGVEGWRLMEVIREYGLPIKAECGGACACGTCHVYVAKEWMDKLYPPRADEVEQMDEVFGLQDNSRLSCQIILDEKLDGLKVTLAAGTEI